MTLSTLAPAKTETVEEMVAFITESADGREVRSSNGAMINHSNGGWEQVCTTDYNQKERQFALSVKEGREGTQSAVSKITLLDEGFDPLDVDKNVIPFILSGNPDSLQPTAN